MLVSFLWIDWMGNREVFFLASGAYQDMIYYGGFFFLYEVIDDWFAMVW